MIKVLFVCVHNSARSQMAEAFMNELGKGMFVAESAGLRPGELNPDVIDSMAEIGYDIKNSETKSVFDFYKEGRRYHYVIKVCDQMNGQKCPIFPASKKQIDWNHEDPSSFEGSKEERLDQVRLIREDIRKNVLDFIEYHQISDFNYLKAPLKSIDTTNVTSMKNEVSIDHLFVKDNGSTYYGATVEWFKKKEQVQFGNSIVTATNIILFDFAKSIKQAYDKDVLNSMQVRGLMDEMWEILYPIKQGKVSLQAFINGVEFFATSKRINYSSTYRTIDSTTSKNIKDSIIEFITDALSNNRPVAFLNQNSSSLNNQWDWVLIFKVENEGKTVSVLDNGKVESIDLLEWLNMEAAEGGFVYFQ